MLKSYPHIVCRMTQPSWNKSSLLPSPYLVTIHEGIVARDLKDQNWITSELQGFHLLSSLPSSVRPHSDCSSSGADPLGHKWGHLWQSSCKNGKTAGEAKCWHGVLLSGQLHDHLPSERPGTHNWRECLRQRGKCPGQRSCLERATRWPWIRVGVRRTETFEEINIDGSLLIQRAGYRMQQWAPE